MLKFSSGWDPGTDCHATFTSKVSQLLAFDRMEAEGIEVSVYGTPPEEPYTRSDESDNEDEPDD